MYIYLGPFPGKFGGVTVKNNLIFNALKERNVQVVKSKFYNSKLSYLQLFIEFLSKHPFIIGLSSHSMLATTKLLYILNKNKMEKSVIIVMGGNLDRIINNKQIIMLNSYKSIYVELIQMKNQLEDLGLKNVKILPNPKEDYENYDLNKNITRKNKLLYFSQVSKMKGFNDILEIDNLIDRFNLDLKIDVYGEIDNEYKNEFESKINKTIVTSYKGVFKANNSESLYELISDYDVMLFPTKWETEGIPGIIVESKIVGIPIIASDKSYNKHLINNEKDGYIINNINGEKILNKLIYLYDTENLLVEMKINSRDSSKNYLIENNISELVKELEGF